MLLVYSKSQVKVTGLGSKTDTRGYFSRKENFKTREAQLVPPTTSLPHWVGASQSLQKPGESKSSQALERPTVGSGQPAHWACAGGGPPGRLRKP